MTEIEASLAVWQAMGNRVYEASSHSQLGILHRLRGDLDRAETQTRQALAIRESLDHPDTWKVYANLADIARARNDAPTAADWQSKADAKRAEMKRRAAGPAPAPGDQPAAPDRQLTVALLALAQSVHQARTQHRAPEPDAAEALAQLAGLPTPWARSGPSCRPSPAVRTRPHPRTSPSPWPNSPPPCARPWPARHPDPDPPGGGASTTSLGWERRTPVRRVLANKADGGV